MKGSGNSKGKKDAVNFKKKAMKVEDALNNDFFKAAIVDG